MNELTRLNAEQTMSSLQIAELTGKRHDAILRDVRNLLEQGVAAHNFVVSEYTDKTGRSLPCYQLTKTGCLILASGYNALLREKIINRWIELEMATAPQVPKTLKEALYFAAAQQERIEEQQRLLAEQEATIKADAPKVSFADAIIASNTSCLIGELAKILTQNGYEIGQNRLFKWLRDNGYLGKRGEQRNIPNQQYVEQGLFEIKKGVRSGNDGVMHTTSTPKVTTKGQQYFINKFLAQKSPL